MFINIKDFMSNHNYKQPEEAANRLIDMVMTGNDLDIEGEFTLSLMKNTSSIWWDNGDDLACSSSLGESLTRLSSIIEYALKNN